MSASCGFLVFGLARSVIVALPGRMLVGFGYALYSITALTTVQRSTHTHRLGVVVTSWRSIENLSTALFLATAGFLADIVGVAYAVLLSAALTFVALTGALFSSRTGKGGQVEQATCS